MQSLGNKFLLFIVIFQFQYAYSNIVTRNFNSSNGLVNNSVRCFYEDGKNGELWIGTDGGISIYDGYSFKSITVNDGLIGNYVWSIISDSFGGKWVASYSKGLTYIKNGDFTKYDSSDGLSNTNIRTLYYENEKLLIGTDNGLFQFDYKTKSIKKILPPIKGKYPFQVMQFLEKGNKLIVATRKNGIYELISSKTDSLYLKKIGKGKTLFKIIPSKNKFLYCSGSGVFEQSKLLGDYENKIHNNVIWDYTYSTVSNELYLASWNVVDAGGALLKAEKDTLVSYNESFGIDSKKIWSCKSLENNQLAVGSLDKGFYIIDTQLNEVEKVPLHNVQGVVEIENNTYYYDETRVYTEKGVPVFSLNQKKISEWFNVKDLVQKSLSDSLSVLESLLRKNHQINAVKYFKAGIYISTSIGLFKLSNTFKVEKILRIQIDKFDIIDSTLIYQRPYHEFNIFENFFSKNYSRIKLKLNDSVPSDVLRYQSLGDSILIWTKTKGVFIYKDGKKSYKLNLSRNYGSIKHVDSWDNKVVIVNSKDEVFKGLVNGASIEFNQIQIPIAIKSIYKASLNQNYFMIHYDNGVFLSNGSIHRVLNQSNLLREAEDYISFLSSENVNVVSANSVIQIPLDIVFSYQTKMPKVQFKSGDSNIPYNQSSVVLEIDKKSVHLPTDYKYYYQLNGLDTIPISGEKIYLMNLSSGKYKVEILTYSTFQNKWLTSSSSSSSFNKLKAPWEKLYFWILGITFIGGVLIVFYYKRKVTLDKRMLERQNIEKKLIRHKLEAIQAKMNPHFMFNALNSIQNYIIDTDTDNALLYLSEFSKLMRQTVDYSSMNSVRLSEEIEFLERYIRIEQMRFTNKIILEKNIDGSIHNIEVPPMILQPLIENAFIHGLKITTDSTQIIKLAFKEIDDSMVKIIVSNPKSNLKQSYKSHKSFGLESIEERLKLVNPKNSLNIMDSETEFIVEIELYANEKTLNPNA